MFEKYRYFTFGDLLRSFRQRHGMTQEQLGYQMHRHRNTIGGWERDRLPVAREDILLLETTELNLLKEEIDLLLYKAGYPVEYGTPIAEQLSTAGFSAQRVEQAAPPGKAAISPVPLEKLLPVPHFVGREEDIQWVLDHLHPGHMVTLIGPAGIGKTQIAAKAVNRLAPGKDAPERFPDGIVFYSFYGENKKNEAETALKHIITSFEETPKHPLDETALAVLASKRALVWLDGTERADDLIRVLDVRGKKCGVLITSQKRNDSKEFWRDVEPLPFEEADALLIALAGDRASHTTARKRIYELVGDVTLAIELAGAHLRDLQDEEQLEDYLTWLAERRLQALHTGDHRRESVYVLMKRSVSLVSQRFGEGARLVLAIMGILASQPVDATLLAAALGVQEYDVKPLLEGLVDYSMLIRVRNRYTIRHNLIYDYIKEYLHAPDEAVTHLATHYAKLAEEQTEWGSIWLGPERPHIAAVVTSCIARKQWREAQRLVRGIEDGSDLVYWDYRETVLQAGLTAATALQDRYAEGHFLTKLGIFYVAARTWEQANKYLERGKQIFDQLGDGFWLWIFFMSRSYYNFIYDRHDKYDEKDDLEQDIAHYEQLIQISEHVGDRNGLATACSCLGSVYLHKGEWEQAIRFFQQSLQIYQPLGDIHDLLKTYGTLDWIFAAGNDWKQASEQATEFYQSLMLNEQRDDIFSLHESFIRAENWTELGEFCLKTDRSEVAKPFFAYAYLVYARTGSPVSEIAAAAGLVYACGSLEAANAYLAQMEDAEARDSE